MTARAAGRAASPLSLALAVALLLVLVVMPTVAAAATIEERMAACLACHGANGHSLMPVTPSLGGQPSFFVIAQLVLFRRGGRSNPAMTAVAQPLTDEDLRALGDAVAKLPPPPPPSTSADPPRLARGQALARRRPCSGCHNPDFSGRQQMPRLAHQREDYLLKTMREYKSGARIGYGGAMAEELVGLSDDDLQDLAHFLTHFPGT